MTLKVLSLFSGIGAFEKALTNLGIDYELVGFSEIDEYAIKSYCSIHNEPESKNLGDVSKVKIEDIDDFDLMTYGFPCTDISVAGRQQGLKEGSGTRSSLLWEAMKIAKIKKPKYMIAENVKNLVGNKFKDDFNKWLNELDELGYNTYWDVLNAKDYEIPQNRQRVFVVSIRKDVDDGTFAFPKQIPLNKCLGEFFDKDIDNKYYISVDKISKIHNWKSYQNPMDRIIGSKSLCPTLTARGAGEYHSGAIVIGKCETNTNIRNEIDVDINNTYIKYNLRFLTPHESIVLMGFSDEDYVAITRVNTPERQIYKQAGNSIVVNVALHIFKELFYV